MNKTIQIHTDNSYLIELLIKPKNICWSKHCIAFINEQPVHIEANHNYLEVTSRGGPITEEDIELWLAQNYNAIESIGYELLEHEQ